MPKRKVPTMTDSERKAYYDAQIPSHYEKPGKQRVNARAAISTVRSLDVSDLEKLLEATALEIYMRGGQRLIPLRPFVLVRVIPKEMMSVGGIIIPDKEQNKPTFEGIVLETYRPYTEERIIKKEWADGTVEETVGICNFECPLKTGQRVLYPYYEGIDHQILGSNYKLIRVAADQVKFPYMQCLGVIDYEGDLEIQAQIVNLMEQFRSITTSGVSISRGGDPTKVAK